ncbi:hypothetical protein FQP86_10820 [Cobetia crustatorum]|uniref:Uncharacterized protein n=1 Tax=Cobetia crustatorum TaxID=553385 RepID=A0A558HKD1_9GAMM|nr:hypothetical protein FQP86_10820 [Cobetia crustatorum]
MLAGNDTSRRFLSTPALSTPALSTPALSTPALSTPALPAPAHSTPRILQINPCAGYGSLHVPPGR